MSARLLTMIVPVEESETGPVNVLSPVRRIFPEPALVREIFALAPSVMRPVMSDAVPPLIRKSAVPDAAVFVIRPALRTTAADCVAAFTLTPLRSSVVPWRSVRL